MKWLWILTLGMAVGYMAMALGAPQWVAFILALWIFFKEYKDDENR